MGWHLIGAMHDRDRIRPTVLDIDLDAVRANAQLCIRAAGVPLVAVVKADAYGHGVLPVARALSGAPGVRGFAVNLVEEAVHLRDAGLTEPILVMGPTLAGGYRAVVEQALLPMVSSEQDLRGLNQAGSVLGRRVAVHLMFDTGMNRLGFVPAQSEALRGLLRTLPHISVTGLCTHMARADSDDPEHPESFTRRQLARFEAVSRSFAKTASEPPLVRHLANSAAVLRFPGTGLDFARVGVALYGNGVGPLDPAFGALQPVIQLSTQVARVRTLAAGESVSYGALFRTERSSSIAVLPLGYADGVPRRVTGQAQVLVHGQRCPIVGVVTMGMLMVDITDVSRPVRVGTPVVVIGSQGGARISVNEFARWSQCIEYEVVCGIGQRVPRVYRSGAGAVS